jgi:hypothetical protein
MGYQHSGQLRCTDVALTLPDPKQSRFRETEVGQTLWLTTDVARQFISILEAGIAKIESGEYQENEYKGISDMPNFHSTGTLGLIYSPSCITPPVITLLRT